jgi:4-aminobutyrate aminotransferase
MASAERSMSALVVLQFETDRRMATLACRVVSPIQQVPSVCAAAGLAVLETIESESLMDNAAEVGAALQDGLRGLAQRHPMVGDVRGCGLAIGVKLVTNRQSRAPATKQAAQLVARAFELGLVLYYVGASSNVLEMTPPLTLTTGEAAKAVSILDRALGDVAEGRVPDDIAAGFEGW